MIKKIKKNYIYIFIFLSTFLFRIAMFCFNGKMRMIQDEVGMLSAGAYIAGRNWSSIMTGISYYGGGYSVLFFPLWKLTTDIQIIYWGIMVIGAILISFSAVVCCLILKKHFLLNKDILVYLISAVCYFLSLPDMSYINNEPMIILCTWVIVYLLLELLEKSNNKKKQKTIYLFLLAGYLITIHTRTIVIWGVGFFITFVYYFIYKKWILEWKLAGVCAVFIGGGSVFITKIVQRIIWGADTNSNLNNSIEGTTNRIIENVEKMITLDYLKVCVDILLGNIYTIVFFTLGFFIVGILILFREFFNQEKKIYDLENLKIKTGILFSILCIFITLFGVAVVWGINVQIAIEKGYIDNYQFKSFTYLRYYTLYCSILVMFVSVYLYKYKKYLSKLLRVKNIIIFLILYYWLKVILPIIKDSEYAFMTFSSFANWKLGDKVSYQEYMSGIVIFVILFIVGWKLYSKKNIYFILTFILIMLVFQSGYKSIVLSRTFTDRAEASSVFINSLEASVGLIEYPIYADVRQTGLAPFQLYLNKYLINKGFPEEEVESAIVFTEWYNLNDESKKEREEQGYLVAQLDENEYIWVKGKELQKKIIENGTKLESIN